MAYDEESLWNTPSEFDPFGDDCDDADDPLYQTPPKAPVQSRGGLGGTKVTTVTAPDIVRRHVTPPTPSALASGSQYPLASSWKSHAGGRLGVRVVECTVNMAWHCTPSAPLAATGDHHTTPHHHTTSHRPSCCGHRYTDSTHPTAH
jgi:hypothetical protein